MAFYLFLAEGSRLAISNRGVLGRGKLRQFKGKYFALIFEDPTLPDLQIKTAPLSCPDLLASNTISVAYEIAHNSTTIAHESRNNSPANCRKGLQSGKLG